MNSKKNELFEQHQSKLLAYIRGRVNHPEDAEDILSKVFFKLVERNQALDNPVAWLFRVAKNSIIDYYRSHRPTEELPDDLMQKDQESNHFEELSACLRPMVEALKDPYKEAVLMADIEGLKQAEVAELLNISLPAVKSRILRGRKNLHELLQKCCPPLRNKHGDITTFEQNSDSCENCTLH